MGTAEKSRDVRAKNDEPPARRLPWHAPQLIKSASIERLTGTHAKSSGGDLHPFSSSVS
jgi:hypothetical protein